MATTTDYTGTAAAESAVPGFGLRAVMQELRRVVWPTREELIRMTLVVILTVLIVASFVAIVDTILQQAAKAVYGAT